MRYTENDDGSLQVDEKVDIRVISTWDTVVGVQGLLERMKQVSKGTSEVPVHKCTQPGKPAGGPHVVCVIEKLRLQ